MKTISAVLTVAILSLAVLGSVGKPGIDDNAVGKTSDADARPEVLAIPPSITRESIAAMHAFYVEGFVEREGFGLSRLVKPWPEHRSITLRGRERTVASIQLIGVVDRDEPVAHGPTLNPGMHMAKRKARALTEFESAALEAFREGTPTVLGGTTDEPIVIGALRARKPCTGCHDGEIGDVFGAFVYRFEA